MDASRAGRGVIEGVAGVERSDDGEAEAALVARARVEPAAFATLYDRYAVPVYRYCYARLGTREAAEDATSQVFTNALAALPRYRERGSFAAWLFAIAHNVVADAQRRDGRFVADLLDERIDPAPSPEEHVLAGEAERRRRPLARFGHHPVDPEEPVVRVDPWRRAGREHGEVVLHVLAGWHAIRELRRDSASAAEAA